MELQAVKQRFGIIGNSDGLNRAMETALRVAPTDLSVLVTGESGVGKESIPKIIHASSARKHNKYVAVNCGAIPEGTMDSELFGHVKGSFTGATGERKGYFEEAHKGTIFLDEVAEMPMQTQVKLLRVLESGEFIKVGSSTPQKTEVRVIAATNVNVIEAIEKGKFREDLYYRLNTVPITLPSLRERKEDIHLLFRKFAYDFAEKYRMPVVRLNNEAIQYLQSYYWHGNIRQLKNITEQISIIEQAREIDGSTLLKYLPDFQERNLPVLRQSTSSNKNHGTSQEMLYTMLSMKKELDMLKKVVSELMQNGKIAPEATSEMQPYYESSTNVMETETNELIPVSVPNSNQTIPLSNSFDSNTEEYIHEEVEEVLSLEEKEKELIKKALTKHNGKRKYAAKELGISERTLYRKIKEYNLK